MYGYESAASTFSSSGCAYAIQRHAQNLVTYLQRERSLEGCEQRPIIFVCHGLGGILVKKALMHSSSQTSAKVDIYYSIFVSTYAILFFGTPHLQHELTIWLNLETIQKSKLHGIYRRGPKTKPFHEKDSETLQLINNQFIPLLKQFHIFFFWEELPTHFGDSAEYVVEESSAAPTLDDTERAGIYATHLGMVKYSDPRSPSYRTIIAALIRYVRAAPTVIRRRWKQASAFLRQTRSDEAFELAGLIFDVRTEGSFRIKHEAPEKSLNEYFYPPQETAIDFIGREDAMKAMGKSLFSTDATSTFPHQRRFVVYGMGGSGKTQICCKFARDHKEQ